MEKPIETLCTNVLAALRESGYTEGGVRKHAATYKLLLAFAAEKHADRYTEQLGRQFMASRYGAVWDGKRGNNSYQANERIVHLEKLWHHLQYGTIIFSARSGKKLPFTCPQNFTREYEAFSANCADRDYAMDTRRTALYTTQKFLLYLDAQGVAGLDVVSASETEGFLGIYADCSASHIKDTVSRLSVFLKFLHSSGATSEDKSLLLPKLKYVREVFLPSSMNQSDIDRILKAVEINSSIGKRDYALLLLVIRLGLRSRDIHNVRLCDFDWKNRQLRITQSKTKEEIALPLPNDVGWAVIDYLRNGRPKTEEVNLFVRHSPEGGPISQNNTLGSVLQKYMRRAGISIPKEQHRGLHSLRSSLARSMLESGNTLPVISEVLGHRSTQSTSHYLRIDLENLGKCPIDPEGVFAE